MRNVIGFLIGMVLGSGAAALTFLCFYSLPAEPDPRNHNGEAFAILVLVMAICGGFIGHRGFTADFFSDLLWPVGVVYGIIMFLCLLSSISFGEIAIMIGLASAGVLASAAGSILLRKWFPPNRP